MQNYSVELAKARFSELQQTIDELQTMAFEGNVNFLKGQEKQFLGRIAVKKQQLFFDDRFAQEHIFELFLEHGDEIVFVSEPEQISSTSKQMLLEQFTEAWDLYVADFVSLQALIPPLHLRLKVNLPGLFHYKDQTQDLTFFELIVLSLVRRKRVVRDILQSTEFGAKTPILRSLISLRRKNCILVIN